MDGRKPYLWIAVEADEYELPLAVADSARELGDMMGMSKHLVESRVSKKCSGKISGIKFLKVRYKECQ